ncbi:hypothetical protein SCB29_27405 [Paraburkholderia sp. SIMBA_055]|jgi:hypothetical protein
MQITINLAGASAEQKARFQGEAFTPNHCRSARWRKTLASAEQKKPYTKPPPAKDPGQKASIFKTRSFKWLVDTVGAESFLRSDGSKRKRTPTTALSLSSVANTLHFPEPSLLRL